MLKENFKIIGAILGFVAFVTVFFGVTFGFPRIPPDSATHFQGLCDAGFISASREPCSLAAQFRSAQSAEATGFWTFMATVLAAGAFGALLVQLHLFRSSDRTQNRAYVHVDHWEWIIGDPIRTDRWGIVPIIKNSGKTPATDMVVFACGVVTPNSSVKHINFDDTGEGHFQHVGYFAPGATNKALGWEFEVSDFHDQRQGQSHIFIWGFVEYTTFSGERCVTRYCESFVTVGPNFNNFENIGASSNTQATHNCADQDCTVQFGLALPSIQRRALGGEWVTEQSSNS